MKAYSQKLKTFRILILGQNLVGKSAIVVRFITRRYIGEYDSKERLYNFKTKIDNEMVNFEILDSAGFFIQEDESLVNQLEMNIRWADAFILVYSVTDKCSFEEINRLKFLINYNKKRKKLHRMDDSMETQPVILVANKIDQINDRMVSKDEGQRMCIECAFSCFHEISARESIDEVFGVFQDACRFWRFFSKFPNLKRSKSDSMRLSMTIHSDGRFGLNPDGIQIICSKKQSEKNQSTLLLGSNNLDAEEKDEFEEMEQIFNLNEPFRSRAKTDGNLLLSRTKRWKVTSPFLSANITQCSPDYRMINRRNSISMRGHMSY